MKIAVLNFSGNVGKTTIAKQCLSPRMNNCPVLFVESINEGGDENNIKGKNFKDVLVEMSLLDDVVVDIGSSNIEQVMIQLKKMVGSHEDFDFYVIPTEPSEKQQKDTINIFTDLIELGIEPAAIKLLFNKVDIDGDLKKIFPAIVDMLAQFELTANAVIHLSEVFPLIGKMSIDEAIAEGVDFKAQIAAATDPQKKREIATALGISRMAKTAKRELDDAFAAMAFK